MKMGLNPATSEVNQQSRHQDLTGGDRIPGQALAGLSERQENREETDRAAQKNGSPDMLVGLTYSSNPGPRRDPQSRHDAGDPLHAHEDREQAVRVAVDLLLV